MSGDQWILWGISVSAFALVLWDRWKAYSSGKRAGAHHVSASYDDETDSVMVRNDGTLPVVLLLISLGPGARPNQIPLDDGHGNLTHVNRISPIDPSPRLGVPRRPVELPTSRLLAPGEARNFPVEVIEEGAGRVSDDELRHVLTHPEIVLRDANGELWVRCEHEVVPFREPSALEIRFAFWLRRHDVFGDLWKRLVVFAAVRASTKHPRRPGLLVRALHRLFEWPYGVDPSPFPHGLPKSWRYQLPLTQEHMDELLNKGDAYKHLG